jgi:hypothetical protein
MTFARKCVKNGKATVGRRGPKAGLSADEVLIAAQYRVDKL